VEITDISTTVYKVVSIDISTYEDTS